MRRYCLLLSFKALGYHVIPSPRLWCFVQPKITNLTARLWCIVRVKIRPGFGNRFWAAVWPVFLDLRVSQRFGTRNRPIPSDSPARQYVLLSHSNSASFGVGPDEIDLVHRSGISQRSEPFQLSSICSLQRVEYSIIQWLESMRAVCW